MILVFIRLLIFIIIFLREKSFILVSFSYVLSLTCILFFFRRNLFLLYIYFELSIFPILLIILGFGRQIEKIRSGYYVLFYSSICSLPFLVVLFNLNVIDYKVFFIFNLSWELCFFVFLLFLIKFPLYYLHLWLPKAHVEAPTRARILLAGLLLKLGTGGFLRVLYLLKFNFEYLLFFISFLGFFFSCFLCVFQSDLKSLAAYSSINHIIFLLLLLRIIRVLRKFRSVLIIIAHGFISTLIFFFVGEFYHLSRTRMLYFFGGYLKSNLYFLIIFRLTWLFNGGVPFSLSFFAEYVGFVVIFNVLNFIFFLMFFYFFVSFYYTLYVIVSGFLIKNIFKVVLWNRFFSLFILIWGLNIFVINFFF